MNNTLMQLCHGILSFNATVLHDVIELQSSILNRCQSHFFCFRYLLGAPFATIRPAREGSIPIVTVTVMPGLRSAAVAFCPLTLISVNCVIVNVFVPFSSVTVIVFALTLAITGCLYGAGVGFFFVAQ